MWNCDRQIFRYRYLSFVIELFKRSSFSFVDHARGVLIMCAIQGSFVQQTFIFGPSSLTTKANQPTIERIMAFSRQHGNWFMSTLRLMVTALVVLPFSCQGFSPLVATQHKLTLRGFVQDSNSPLSKPLYSAKHLTRQTNTHLFQSKGGAQVDGTGRGLAIFSLVFAVCIWLFSIPTEFRRAHLCMTEQCVQNRARCYDCVTFSEWKDGITQYYQNGGGVQFDFSVADETKAFWQGGTANWCKSPKVIPQFTVLG